MLFLGVFAFCYFHQIAMISVIKLHRVAGLADLHVKVVNFFRLLLVFKVVV